MKILIDQNISFRILPYVKPEFEFIAHVKDLGLTDFSDHKIFQFARKNEFVAILTLDEDFNNLQIEFGVPPKIIWLRVGNCSTKILAQLILDKASIIKKFLLDEQTECLEIFA